jgi:O-antigen chain-terminating methyltransferase
MAPFKIPEPPYTIEGIMDELNRQWGERPGAPSSDRDVESAESEAFDPAPEVGVAIARVEAARRLSRDYRIASHRPLIGPVIDAVKRLIHWGSRPYIDLIAERQESMNDAVVEALRGLHRRLARIEARHDLAPFFREVEPRRRMIGVERTRGSMRDIAERQSRYVEIFRDRPGPTIDLGCGRGEFLRALEEAGVAAFGCDIDPLMTKIARREGLDARQTDALTALRAASPASLGGVFAAQLIEHLFPGELLELIRLARSRLAPGGAIVLESLNPQSLGVLAKSYYKDIEHKQPIDPDYLGELLRLAGFESVEVRRAMPFGEEDRLPDLPPREATGLNAEADEALRATIDRLNAAIWGDQDYYVAAETPGESPATSNGA